MTTKQKLLGIPLAAVALLAGGAVAGYTGLASAQTTGAAAPGTTQPQNGVPGPWHRGEHGPGKGHGVAGTVSAINGTTITLTGKDGTTYTVDAASAKVSKMVELSVGDIKVGDTLGVQGSVSGSSVTAAHIMDGLPPQPPQQ